MTRTTKAAVQSVQGAGQGAHKNTVNTTEKPAPPPLKASSSNEIPRLENFKFKLDRSQYLRGASNYQSYLFHLNLAKMAAGWEEGAPLHWQDEKLIASRILGTVIPRSVAEGMIVHCKTGTEMEAVIVRNYNWGDNPRIDECKFPRYIGGKWW